MAQIPAITLNNGVPIPQLGFGVFQIPPEETAAAVTAAFEAGYRHIDTATIYGNEAGVGEAVAAAAIPRDQLFITTKLWNTDQGYDEALRAFDRSAAELQLDVVDLYLIHWPVSALDRYAESWRALERLQAEGRVRAIGVSNFQPDHLQRLIDQFEVVPAVNQIELHPLLQQPEVRAFNARHGIATQAWSPLAKGGAILDHPQLAAIARRHGKSAAQVILRWQIELGNVVIPKSVTPKRIAENAAVFDFELTAEEMAAIATLDRGERTGPHPDSSEFD